MRATIVDNQWIYLDHLTDSEDEIIWIEFSVSRPNRYVDPAQRGNWDGIYRKYNRIKHRIARPLLAYLRSVCKKHNIPLIVIDKRPAWNYTVDTSIDKHSLAGITLDDFQVRAIQKAISCECMIIDFPTGSGKTEAMCGICKAIDCPTIIMADMKVVIDQIKSRLELRDVTDEVGLFYAGKRPSGQSIVVGSIQSITMPTKPPMIPKRKANEPDDSYAKRLDRWDKSFKAYKTRCQNVKNLQQYIHDAEMIIVDECDRAVSVSWKNLFRFHYKGRRRYGLSGTPFDPSKPVEALELQEHLGSVIIKESRAYMTQLGRIIPCEYFAFAFGLEGDIHDASTYDLAYDEWMTDNVTYHSLIAKLCKLYSKPKDGTLILVDRERLGHALQKAISDIGLRCEFIFGKTPKRRRDLALRAFENRELDVLIGGKIINRGLDLAGGCENLIIATGGKLQSDFIQKIGRALRRNNYGKSKIFDFFHRGNKHLYGHSKNRLKAVVGAGYKATVVFPGGRVDGAAFITSRFHVSKNLLQAKPI